MIICHCIKDYDWDESFKVGEECHYYIDKDGCVFVYKHPSRYYPDEMFESIEEFHEYFKDD